jgi:hypothetical protein
VGDGPLTQLLATGSDSITRQYNVSRHGRETPFSVSVYPLRDKTGGSVGGIETFRRLVPAVAAPDFGGGGVQPPGSIPRPKISPGVHPLEASQRRVIEEVLRQHRWNRAAACKELGLSRTTLWRKMRRLGITPPSA